MTTGPPHDALESMDTFHAPGVAESSAALAPPQTPLSSDAQAFAHVTPLAPPPPVATPQKQTRFSRAPKQEKEPKIAKAPKEPKLAKGAKIPKGEKEPKVAKGALTTIPVLTSFDLFGGAYQRVIRARLITMIIAGVFSLATLLFIATGFQASVRSSALATQLATLKTASSLLSTKLGAATNYTPPGEPTHYGTIMQQDIAFRAPIVQTDTTTALNIAKILADVRGIQVPGVTIEGIQVSSTPATTATAPATTVPAVTTTGATPTTTPPPAGRPISISFLATSSKSMEAWFAKAERLPYLSASAPTWSGNAPALNGTLVATVQGLSYPTPKAAQAQSQPATGVTHG
jgi:hypothetical protein